MIRIATVSLVALLFIAACGTAPTYRGGGVECTSGDWSAGASAGHGPSSSTDNRMMTEIDLPQDSLNAWLTMTSDSGAVWVGKKVRDYLESEGLSTNLQFRFSPALSDIVACNDLYNGQSGAFYSVDSIVSDYIHLDVPMFIIKVGEVRYYTWIDPRSGNRRRKYLAEHPMY